MLRSLDEDERRALFAHERAHLSCRHHCSLLVVSLAGCVNPLLLRSAVAFATERWADEGAARVVGDRRLTARAVGRAALVTAAGTAASAISALNAAVALFVVLKAATPL